MPLSRRLARFNKHFTNRIVGLVAGWAPGFAIVQHVGKKTGRAYETPVNVFRRGDLYVFALTYGGGSWVDNVLAAGGCSVRTRRRTIRLTEPVRYTDPTRGDVPAPVRWILEMLDVDEFLSLRVAL